MLEHQGFQLAVEKTTPATTRQKGVADDDVPRSLVVLVKTGAADHRTRGALADHQTTPADQQALEQGAEDLEPPAIMRRMLFPDEGVRRHAMERIEIAANERLHEQ